MISLSNLPSIDEVWAALPEKARANLYVIDRIKSSGPRLAAATYKDFFWMQNPSDRGMIHSLPDDQLLRLMIALYVYQGGDEPAVELAFWEKIFAA